MKEKNTNSLIPRLAILEKKIQETEDTCSFKLRLLDGNKFPFSPGQFNMLGLPGFGEAPLSFSSLILENNSFIHTIRRAGNVTKAIFDLKTGETLNVRGPYGNGWPLEKAAGKHLIIVAGGIGMAPLRPVMYHVLKNRKKFLKVFLLVGNRTEKDILFRNELKRWSGLKDISIFLSVDEKSTRSTSLRVDAESAEASKKSTLDTQVGVVTTLIDKIDVPFWKAITFTCGPEIMMRFVAKSLILKGQSKDDIFVSMERRMKCGVSLCGHCQIGAKYVCKDGPVFAYRDIKRFIDTLL